MSKSSQTKNGPAGSEQVPTGDLTRKAIKLLPVLTDRIVTELMAEPCPDGQAALREAVTTALNEAVDITVADAAEVFECLPAEAQATFDEQVANFHVIETSEAVLEQGAAGVKDLVIEIVRRLLPLLPKKLAFLRTVIELVLQLIQTLQKGSTTGVLV